MKVGQALVEGGQSPRRTWPAALAQANGDLLQFADIGLGRYGAGRTEVAIAISQATGVPAVDTKGIVIAEEIKGVLDEAVVRATAPSPWPRRATRWWCCAATRRRSAAPPSRPARSGR
jgi:hypothetical protein